MINPLPAPSRDSAGRSAIVRIGDWWTERTRRTQWIVAVLGVAVLAAPFLSISGLSYAIAVGCLLGLTGLGMWLSRDRPAAQRPDGRSELLERLIASGRPEAEVAAAASRAWNEVRTISIWGSDLMTAHRASIDGDAEVAQITGSALQIMAGRDAIGRRPVGVAREHWNRQHAELDAAAQRLGQRADALIIFQDRVGELSRAAHHLDELRRMERSALAVDDAVASTAYGYEESHRRMAQLADEIAGVRMGVEDLLELLRGR